MENFADPHSQIFFWIPTPEFIPDVYAYSAIQQEVEFIMPGRI